MGELDLLPAELLFPEREEDFLLFLRGLQLPPRRAKQLLVEWTKAVGVALSEDLVNAALGGRRGEAIG